MSSLKKNVFLSVFGAAMSATVAFAADLPAPPVIEYEPEVPVEIGSGWYLRGDLGVTAFSGGRGSYVPDGAPDPKFTNDHYNNGWLAGVGVGYQISDQLRTDLTVDYHGKTKYSAIYPGDLPATTDDTYETVKFSAWTLMLNGYYDIGTWNAITPYVGGGVGLARVSWTDYTSTGYGVADNTQTNFAWNLMAGAAFDIDEQLKLDANYRFLSYGVTETGKPTQAGQNNPVKFENLYTHEFRVGLRYEMD